MEGRMTPQEEYEAALVQYRVAQARLTEAKRYFDPKTSPERRAKQAEYRAKRRAARNTPEAKAERKRWREEQNERVRQQVAEYARRWGT